jgi:predicted RNA binding protein YcfA (HicA-like mRNA interferase family)
VTSRLPLLSGREAVKVFAKAGWLVFHQKGSHIILYKANSERTLSIPDHKEIDRGLLRKLVRQAGMSVEEFCGLRRD